MAKSSILFPGSADWGIGRGGRGRVLGVDGGVDVCGGGGRRKERKREREKETDGCGMYDGGGRGRGTPK